MILCLCRDCCYAARVDTLLREKGEKGLRPQEAYHITHISPRLPPAVAVIAVRGARRHLTILNGGLVMLPKTTKKIVALRP